MKASIDWKGGMLLEGKNAEGMTLIILSKHMALRWRSCFRRWVLVP